MKSNLPYSTLLISTLLSTGCTSTIPSVAVNETVIESILSSTQAEKPWRLDSAWQGSNLGGAALRGASIEHVIRQNDKKTSSVSSVSQAVVLKPKPVPKVVPKPDCNPSSIVK